MFIPAPVQRLEFEAAKPSCICNGSLRVSFRPLNKDGELDIANTLTLEDIPLSGLPGGIESLRPMPQWLFVEKQASADRC